jgi:hypothetical protein
METPRTNASESSAKAGPATATADEPTTTPQPPQKSVNPAVLAVIVVALLGFCFWQYTLYFKLPRIFRGTPITTVVRQKVEESGGDWSKLSKADQDKLNDLTIGNGEKVFKQTADQIAREKAPPKPKAMSSTTNTKPVTKPESKQETKPVVP